MIKKGLLCIGIGICCVMLTGCLGSNIDTTTYTISGWYMVSVPESFSEVNSWLVENQQIVNKVLLAFKQQDAEWFADNMVVTRSEISQELDYEQFRSINSKKLHTTLIGYTPGEQQRVRFECWDRNIAWIFVTFDLRNTFWTSSETTHIAQYQFVDDGDWYIISYATSDADLRDDSKDRLTTITCG